MPPDTMIEALGTIPLATYKDQDTQFVLRDEDEFRDLQPDLELIIKMDGACVAVTTQETEYDCVVNVEDSMEGLLRKLQI